LIEKGVKIPHFCYLGNVRIGKCSNIAAGVITCNFDGAEKHFSIIGERCFIGAGVHLIAPCSLETEVFVGEGISILPFASIKKHSFVVGSGKNYKIKENRSFYIDGIGWLLTSESVDLLLAEKIQFQLEQLRQLIKIKRQKDDVFRKWFYTPNQEFLMSKRPVDCFRELDVEKFEMLMMVIRQQIKSLN